MKSLDTLQRHPSELSPARTRPCVAKTQSSGRWFNLAFFFCVCFGVLLISQVQVAGDGMWFWYADAFLKGMHLYRDLHLPLQPLYPLIVAATIRFLGPGWLISKVVAAVLMVLYALATRMLVRYFPGSDLQRGIAMLYGFSAPLLFQASRFDDYHVLTDNCAAFSLVLLLGLICSSTEERAIPLSRQKAFICAMLLGLCSGLAIVARLNDGAFLTLAVFVALAAAAKGRRIASLGLFCCTAALVVLCVVALTGDSVASWATESILHASGAKGGTAHVVLVPLLLIPFWIKVSWLLPGLIEAPLVLIAICILFLRVKYKSLRPQVRNIHLALIVLLCLLELFLQHRWGVANLPTSINGISVPAAFLVSAYALHLLLNQLASAERVASGLLVLIPFGQLLSGAMSSGGHYVPLTSATGMFLLVLPIAFPDWFAASARKTAYALVLGTAALFSFVFKAQHPFWWHNYVSAPMLVHRQWYKHPQYGPMIIERQLLQLVLPMCETARMQPGQELLSLPFPYANYFCGIAPWHEYVQTFFDLSTRKTIDQLISDLNTRPPGTIVYQRQFSILEGHEAIYAGGKALPHRDLDTLIGQKIDSGAWKVVHEQCLGRNDWITIETRPAVQRPVQSFYSLRYQCGR